MSFGLHEILMPAWLHGLDRLSHFLRKSREFAEHNGIEPAEMIDARLVDDMLPLSGQVQRASDTAKMSAERLSGRPSPKMPDTERSFDELHARIDATAAYLRSIAPDAMNDAGARTITLAFGKSRAEFGGNDYALQFALPNFQFHIVTAYAILRHKGVPLGKLDYLGAIGTVVA